MYNYAFELFRNSATRSNKNTAPPTIQTQGWVKKLPLSDFVLISTSIFLSCANEITDANINAIKNEILFRQADNFTAIFFINEV